MQSNCALNSQNLKILENSASGTRETSARSSIAEDQFNRASESDSDWDESDSSMSSPSDDDYAQMIRNIASGTYPVRANPEPSSGRCGQAYIRPDWDRRSFDKVCSNLKLLQHKSTDRPKKSNLSVNGRWERQVLDLLSMHPPDELLTLWSKTAATIATRTRRGHLRCPGRFLRQLKAAIRKQTTTPL